jgi:hypothetical protein
LELRKEKNKMKMEESIEGQLLSKMELSIPDNG